MSVQFQITHHGNDKLGLRGILQRYADAQWFAEHYTNQQIVDALLVSAQEYHYHDSALRWAGL